MMFNGVLFFSPEMSVNSESLTCSSPPFNTPGRSQEALPLSLSESVIVGAFRVSVAVARTAWPHGLEDVRQRARSLDDLRVRSGGVCTSGQLSCSLFGQE